MGTQTDRVLREHLVKLLEWQSAHASFDAAIEGVPPPARGKRPEHLPYSPWELLEHMRIAQWDILDFCRNPAYASRQWPDEYWPSEPVPSTPDTWEQSVHQFREDRKAMQKFVQDPAVDLYATVPHGSGQTYLREALLVADHNAYHLGQLVVVRRLLGVWK